jgi:hypothetical protein
VQTGHDPRNDRSRSPEYAEMLKGIENTDLEVALRVFERVMENSANLKNS